MNYATNTRLLLLGLLAVVAPSSVAAASITYVFTGNITGTVGTTALTNAPFTWQVTGDTAAIASTGPLRYANTGTSSSITIANTTTSGNQVITIYYGGPVPDTINVAVDGFAAQISMINSSGTFGVMLPTGGSAGKSAGYFLDGAIGPVNAGTGGTFVSTSPLRNASASINITSLANLTFQAFESNSSGKIISQVADGGGWHTGFVASNTTAGPIMFTIGCFQDVGGNSTQLWQIPIVNVSSPPGTVSFPSNILLGPGATAFYTTTGTAANTSIGWCQATGDTGVSLSAIFTQSVKGLPDQDVTSASTGSFPNAIIPFDNTQGLTTSIALVNSGINAITINPYIRGEFGPVSAGTPFVIPARGHLAVNLPDMFPATAGAQGVLDLYSPNGTFSALALRFNSSGGIAGGQVTLQPGSNVFGQ